MRLSSRLTRSLSEFEIIFIAKCAGSEKLLLSVRSFVRSFVGFVWLIFTMHACSRLVKPYRADICKQINLVIIISSVLATDFLLLFSLDMMMLFALKISPDRAPIKASNVQLDRYANRTGPS